MAAIIYRPTDRIELAFEGFKVWVSPLSVEQKAILQGLYRTISGEDKTNAHHVAVETLRMTVKEVEGVFLSDDQPYQLQFGPDGCLTPTCAEELTNLDSADVMIKVGGRVGLGTYRYDDIEGHGSDFKVAIDKARSLKKKE